MTTATPYATTSPDTGLMARPLRASTVGMVGLISLLAFEALAVTTAMPAVAHALDGLRWYALAFGGAAASGVVAMVVAGIWCDSRGPAAPLRHGIGWFVAGLLVAGTAPTMPQFVAGRVVQGFGSGLVIVALYVVVAQAYPERLHRRVFAAFAAAWVVPSLVGPAVAGLVVQYVGWRWVFLAVPVLALPAVLLLRPALRRATLSRRPGTSSATPAPRPDRPASRPDRLPSDEPSAVPDGTDHGGEDTADVPAGSAGHPVPDAGGRIGWALGAATGAALLHYGGQQRGPLAVGLIVLALTALGLCVPRLLPAGFLRARRGLPTVVALRGLAAAAFVGAEVFIPLLLARERDLPPTVAGAVLAAGAVSWAAGSWVQGRIRPTASRATLPRVGLLLMAVGIAGAAVLFGVPVVPVGFGLVAWAVAGLGIGLTYPSFSVLTLGLSAPGEQGRNSASLQLADSLCGATVLAFTGSLLASGAPGPGTFLAGFAVAAGLALAAALLAGRISPQG